MTAMSKSVTTGPLRVAFAAGVTPDKWLRRWRDRRPDPIEAFPDDEGVRALREDRAEMALVRLPVDQTGLHLIPLYAETAVAVLPRDHPYAEEPELALADLVEEHDWTSSLPARQAVETVAAGTGFLVLPRSVARLHHRRDVVAVPLTDVEESRIALAWPVADPGEGDDERLDYFVGIVRGRTQRSSRGDQSGAQVTSRPAAAAPRGTRRRTGSRPPRARRTR